MINPNSLKLYQETYFLPNEDYSSWVDRMTIDRIKTDTLVLDPMGTDLEFLKRMKKYISNQWFHPATPIASNLGSNRGLPISCFVREVEDSKDEIFFAFNEAFFLGSEGTGIGTLWSDVRPVGSPIADGIKGSSSGIIPFIAVSDRATLAVSQGGIRRAAEAVYLDISHPEIEEFINIRKPDREQNRSCPNIHHAVIITDEFMKAVESRSMFNLIDPKTKQVVKEIDAFKLFCSILDVRTRFQGEPYLFFKDNANKNKSKLYKDTNKEIRLSNLCTEINLHTDYDKSNVCCLGSINLEKFDEFSNEFEQLVKDSLRYLDHILDCFVIRVLGFENGKEEAFTRSLKGIKEDRPLGLGVMGFHSLLQKHSIAFEDLNASSFNDIIFNRMNEAVKAYEKECKEDRYLPPCKLASQENYYRNATHIAIAPTMSISNLCNFTSQGIEPFMSNFYTKKLKQGSFQIKNPYLDKVLKDIAKENGYTDTWVEDRWRDIANDGGSVQNLDCLNEHQKRVFKTAFEINQFSIITLAARRQKYIDQGQSINLFFRAGESVKYIYDVHIKAWQRGLNALYYQRSLAESRVKSSNTRQVIEVKECEVCQ
ncbi:hypothetical protein [Campylobacter vicugnae]|uniref:hypothetical protein n=1 Tax=Campylobacter vicugnae TaxID=1660076 RepID=UPI000A34B2C5|nr:hypothetical protein [Campylobacter sp. RM9262]